VGKKPARKKTGGKRHPKNRGQARTTHEGGAPAPPAQLAPRPAVGYNLAANKGPSLAHLLNKYAPGIGALRDYYRPWLRADVFAGIAVAAYLVPQCMAYASIVGVPPVAGLWTALAALTVYAALGGSRVLSVGPESTVALMAGATVAPLTGGDPARAVALTSALALVVAGWCLIARIVRLGVATDLLSTPLLVGYLAGGAVLMVVGQLGRLTGTKVSGEGIVEQVTSFIRVVSDTDLLTLAVGAGTLVLLLAVVRLRPRWPGPLIAVATATIVCAVAQFADRGVAVVGQVPTGLPGVHFPAVTIEDFKRLAVAGLGVAIVAYGDNSLIERGFPAPPDERGGPSRPVDPDQEFVALAGVHVASGLVGGFPGSSSGSRTALALANGARSQLYSLVAAAVIVVVLFAAGPLLSQLPAAALGAVVFYAASKLVSLRELVRLARFRRTELILAATALVGTVTFGILAGVGIAIALSMLEMIQRLARPHEGVLGRVPGLAGMHDVDDYPDAQCLPGLVVYRYDAPLFFANIGDLRRRALLAVEQENAADPKHPVGWFVLNVEANVEIDITAADGLRDLHSDLAKQGVRLGLARVKNDLRIALERANLVELIGADMMFPTLGDMEQGYLAWASEHPYPDMPTSAATSTTVGPATSPSTDPQPSA
jgi:SulP family sulfate permease